MAIPLIIVAFFKLQPQRSVAQEIMFWNTAIIVVRAAKVINRKNIAPQILPPAIWLNTLGRVTNTSPGPSPGSMP